MPSRRTSKQERRYGKHPGGSSRQRHQSGCNTPLQSARRSQLAQRAVNWRSFLTEAQRIAWNALGQATVFQNALGEDFNPSGIQLFVRTSMLRAIAGQGIIATAPVQAVIQLGTLTIVHVVASGIEITAQVGSEVTSGDAIVQISTSRSLGINFFKGPYSTALVFPVEDFALLPRLIRANADLLPARAFFFRIRVIQDTGEATAASLFRVVTSDPL